MISSKNKCIKGKKVFSTHLQLQLQQPRPPRGTAIRLAAMRLWPRPWQRLPRLPRHRCYPTWNLGWNSGWNSGSSQERRSVRVQELPREWQGGPVGLPLQVLRNAPGSHRLLPWPCLNLPTGPIICISLLIILNFSSDTISTLIIILLYILIILMLLYDYHWINIDNLKYWNWRKI